MRYVFDAENGYAILGEFVGWDEGVVLYKATANGQPRRHSFGGRAPEDCVVVKEVTAPEVKGRIENFARQVESAGAWVPDTTGLNSLVQVGVEMIEYAQMMGAALTVDQAYANLRREQKVRYIGTRAHSRQFEEAPAA